MIGNVANATAIRASKGSNQDLQYRRAFLIGDLANNSINSVITEKGLYIDGRELEIVSKNQSYRVKAGVLQETAVSFEQFAVISAN